MRGPGHVKVWGRGEAYTYTYKGFWWGNLKERTNGETQAQMGRQY